MRARCRPGLAPDRPAVRVNRVTVEVPARRMLVHRSGAADQLAVGARRRAGHFGLQPGRVSHTLLHRAACPDAVVPQTVSDAVRAGRDGPAEPHHSHGPRGRRARGPLPGGGLPHTHPPRAFPSPVRPERVPSA